MGKGEERTLAYFAMARRVEDRQAERGKAASTGYVALSLLSPLPLEDPDQREMACVLGGTLDAQIF